MVKPFDAVTKQLVELCWKWPVLCGRSPQALFAKGEAKGREEGEISKTRELILRLGGKRFGTPSPQTGERLNQTRDKALLTVWADRLLEVESWSEFLA